MARAGPSNFKAGDILTCGDCGGTTLRRGPVQLYCEPCSEVRSIETKRKWAAKNPQKKDPAKVKAAYEATQSTLVEVGAENSGRSSLSWIAEAEDDLAWITRVAVPFEWGFSKNAIWATSQHGHTYLRRHAKHLREDLTERLRASVENIEPYRVYHNKLWVDIMVEKPNHRGDAVNVIDLVCDAIKDAVPVDDRWFSLRRVDWCINKNEPRLMVGIGQRDCFDALVCSHCGHVKALDEFHRNKGGPMGRTRVCKSCYSQTQKRLRDERRAA